MINLEENVQAARDRHLAAEGLSTQSYTDPEFKVTVAFVTFRFRNPGLLPYHDLHHVALGYATSLLGEAEISAFELRAGWGVPIILLLCCGSIVVGSFLSPARLWRAWKAARGARSLYKIDTPYADLLAMNVGQLRKLMRLEGE